MSNSLNHGAPGQHPTRQRLIDVTIRLLDNHRPEDITITMVIADGLVSKGAFYHHFNEFEEVIEEALAARFISDIDQALDEFTKLMESATTREELIDLLRSKIEWTENDDERVNIRIERIRTLGKVLNNDRFYKVMSKQQSKTTNQLVEMIESLKSKGLIREGVSARVFATFIQAYTFGRVIDDISVEKVNRAEWNEFLISVYKNYLFE